MRTAYCYAHHKWEPIVKIKGVIQGWDKEREAMIVTGFTDCHYQFNIVATRRQCYEWDLNHAAKIYPGRG